MTQIDEYFDNPLTEFGPFVRGVNVVGRYLVGTSMRIIFRAKYEGREVFDQFPKDQAFVIAGNHSSYTDPMFIFDAIWPKRVRYMAKAQLFNHFILDKVLAWFGVFPVYNDARGRKAIKRAIKCLKRGESIGIFPEGTRIKTHIKENIEYNDGVALIAKMADVPIIPVGLEGTLDISPTGSKWLRYPKVTIRFGQPVYWRDFSASFQKKELFEAVTREVMRRVRCLEKGEDPGPTPESAFLPVKTKHKSAEGAHKPDAESEKSAGSKSASKSSDEAKDNAKDQQ